MGHFTPNWLTRSLPGLHQEQHSDEVREREREWSGDPEKRGALAHSGLSGNFSTEIQCTGCFRLYDTKFCKF